MNNKLDLGTDQIVTFRLAGEELALPINSVQEIIKPTDIIHVPNTPDYIDGIGNLRGGILPIVNLRKKLGLEDQAVSETTRIVVLNTPGGATGFMVDSVSEVMHIEADVLEQPPGIIANIDGQFLRGIAKIDDGKRMVLILSEDQILPELAGLKTDKEESVQQTALHSESEQLVTFHIGGEEFAINIMQVKEIIRVTEITPLPKSPKHTVGVMSLRNQLLPIMDLRIIFDKETIRQEYGAKITQDKLDAQRIVVVDLGGILTGIQVDSVSQVLTLEKNKIVPPPAIIQANTGNRLRSVGKLDNGKRLLMLLDTAKLLTDTDKEKMTEALGKSEEEAKASSVANVQNTDELQLVCFKVDNEEYAINIMKVQEIIRINEITTVPKTKEYMKGIINLRGTVVPVVDMRCRFNLDQPASLEQARIVVANIQGKTTGLIVDSVTEVLRLPKNQIEATPASVSDSVDGKFLEGVGKLNNGKRIIVLINVDAILTHENQVA